MSDTKEHIGVVITGPVDGGKSTTTGHLLYKLGNMDERTKEKLEKEAQELGKSSFSFAFFMDKQKDERERGVTIACTTKEFFTPNYRYTIIDAPGHHDFIKNMISGASQADVAVLMVPANQGAFEAAIQQGDDKAGTAQGQCRQHPELCSLLGIKQLIICVNKMDDPSVQYSEDRFNEIQSEISKIVAGYGYKPEAVPIIPMSGMQGENLVDASPNMPWYKGFNVKINDQTITGHTLFDALNDVVRVPTRKPDAPLRVPISGVYKIKGVGDVICGRVEQGTLTPDTEVTFWPSKATGKVFSIEMHHKPHNAAKPGDNVGLNVKKLDKTNMPKTGDVMVLTKNLDDPNPPRKVVSFRAQVKVVFHPGQLKAATDDGSGGGYAPNVHVRTGRAPCAITKIHWRMGKKTKKQKIEDPAYIEQGDAAEVTFTPRLPIYLESFKNCEGLGRMVAMDGNAPRMIGRILDVEYATV